MDGRVAEGHGAVNQAPITGESMPVEKHAGDPVFAATILERGLLRIETDRVGAETTFGRILRLVEEAEAHKAPVQRFADRFTALLHPRRRGGRAPHLPPGSDPHRRGRSRPGRLLVRDRDGHAHRRAGQCRASGPAGSRRQRGAVARGPGRRWTRWSWTRPGPLTFGPPRVTEVLSLDRLSETEVLARAAAVERYSEHPVAVRGVGGGRGPGPRARRRRRV